MPKSKSSWYAGFSEKHLPTTTHGKVLYVLVTIGFLLLAACASVHLYSAFSFGAPASAPWRTGAALLVAVATLPQFVIEPTAFVAESLTRDLPDEPRTRWLLNTGVFVGFVERPLMVGAVVSGFPEFIAVWFVFKGVAGFRMALKPLALTERRLFQLHLLNNALSLAGVALAILAWRVLGLPMARV